LVRAAGIEPATTAFQVRDSTAELRPVCALVRWRRLVKVGGPAWIRTMISAVKAPHPAVERQGRAPLLLVRIHGAACIASILERIKLPGARHRHGKWSKRMQYLNGAGMFRDYLGQTAVSHRAFIEVSADERDAAFG
jgi:hypothetical protein